MIPTAIRTTLLACLTLHTLNAADPDPIRQTHRVPMRDGTHLATDVWLPAADQAYPVVLLRFPYNKDLAIGLGQDGTRQGYAVVAQDTRGRFASEGENLPFHRDVPDGKDTLAWIKQQPWCNGRIGTWGGSAGAITQFQMAIEGSDPLLAQYLVVGAPNLYDVVYTGGVFRKALIEDWLKGTQFATNALDIWVNHPTYDAYWQARDASRHYPKINTPALHVGGYWDIFAQPTIDAFNGYQNHGGPNARGKQKLLLGPWSHNVLQDKVGDLTFPNGKNPPGQHSNQWRWFDRWLKDQAHEIDTEPAVTYYVIGDTTNPNAPGNVWRTANTWPPLPATPTRYYLHHNHSLTTTPPAENQTLTYTYNPTNPAPTIGGIQLTLPAGPMNQNPIESRNDILVFSTPKLTQPLEVTGQITARIWISSDAPDTDLFVRLCDVYPDGRSFNLCEGMLRTRFRHGLDRETFLQPDDIVPLDINLWSTSVIFAPDHQIRVHVTSSSAPGFDPNPNTRHPFRTNPQTRIARNTLHLSPTHPSHITLPIVTTP